MIIATTPEPPFCSAFGLAVVAYDLAPNGLIWAWLAAAAGQVPVSGVALRWACLTAWRPLATRRLAGGRQ